MSGRWKRATAVAAAIAVMGGAACGGSDDDAPPVDEAGKQIPLADVGTPSETKELVRRFERIQGNFRRDDFTAVCREVSDFLLGQFPPGSKQDGSCTSKMKKFARSLDRGERPELDVLSVRVYPGVEGGIWVSTGDGPNYRIPFVFDISERAWRLELGAFQHPEALDGTLEQDT